MVENKYYVIKKYQKPLLILLVLIIIVAIMILKIGINEQDMQLVLASILWFLVLLLLSYYLYKANQD